MRVTRAKISGWVSWQRFMTFENEKALRWTGWAAANVIVSGRYD